MLAMLITEALSDFCSIGAKAVVTKYGPATLTGSEDALCQMRRRLPDYPQLTRALNRNVLAASVPSAVSLHGRVARLTLRHSRAFAEHPELLIRNLSLVLV